ncbi:MAG: hypothetical protein AAGD96_12375 [Chloroflexota bacterium]
MDNQIIKLARIIVVLPIFAILIGCGWTLFTIEYGTQLNLQKSDFTIEDPTNQSEIAHAFIHSVAFNQIDGIKPYIASSEHDDLERLIAQLKLANDRCRIPFDQVLSLSSSSYLKESISIEYACPDENNFIKFTPYILSADIYFFEDEDGHLMIKHWCDTRQGFGNEIGRSCLIKNLTNP